MKRALYLALFLAITAGLSGGMLSFVNDLTKDKIEAAALEKELIYLEEIFPGATFTAKTDEVNGDDGVIDLFEAEGKGVVYKLVQSGYGGDITFLVGFDNDQKIAGIAVISHSETPGFGDVIETDGYRALNVGKSGGDALDVSSGATVSSKAINAGIQAAAKHLAGGELVIEETPLDFNDPIEFASEKLEKYKSEIISKEVDGENTVYEVKSEGYGIHDFEYPNDSYKENVFKITVKTETHEIVNIEMLEFGDTKKLGDAIDSNQYYDKFVGLSSTEGSIDTVTNATKTSYSLISAVKTVLEDK